MKFHLSNGGDIRVCRYNCYHRTTGYMEEKGTQNINPYEILHEGAGCFIVTMLGKEGYFNGKRILIPVRNVTFIEEDELSWEPLDWSEDDTHGVGYRG